MQKSRFWTLIFSVIPGLGHIYVGMPARGICIMGGFFAWAFAAMLVGFRWGGFETLLMLAPLLIIWLASLADALHQCDKTAAIQNASPSSVQWDGPNSEKPDQFWIFLFSLVPGAGHMYLGWMRKGVELMGMFFGTMYLSHSLNLNLFLFTLPVIWFYSFFDALQLSSGRSRLAEKDCSFILSIRQEWLGISLLVLGVVILFDRVASPLFSISYQTQEMIKACITAFLFLGGGVWLLRNKKSEVMLSGHTKESNEQGS
jgi:hypothetical protein